VLALIRDGLQNSEIAIRLGVSVNTVRFHVSNLLAKSGLPDRVLLRNWQPGPEAPRRRLPALALPLLKPLGIVGATGGAVAVATLAILAFGGRAEDPRPPADQEPFAYPGAVVGMLTRQPGGLVVTEPGGSSYRLTSEMTFARWVGSQVFILGQVEGDRLTPTAGSPIGNYSRCAGVLSETNGRLSVGGGCGGMELSGVPLERTLALRSEKVTVSVLRCTQSHGGCLENPPIDAFGEEQVHTCPGSPSEVTLAQR
jgi:hypothetical protein